MSSSSASHLLHKDGHLTVGNTDQVHATSHGNQVHKCSQDIRDRAITDPLQVTNDKHSTDASLPGAAAIGKGKKSGNGEKIVKGKKPDEQANGDKKPGDELSPNL